MSKNINTTNSKGQLHGYQERYGYIDGKLESRGSCKNQRPCEYIEWHKHKVTVFYIK